MGSKNALTVEATGNGFHEVYRQEGPARVRLGVMWREGRGWAYETRNRAIRTASTRKSALTDLDSATPHSCLR